MTAGCRTPLQLTAANSVFNGPIYPSVKIQNGAQYQGVLCCAVLCVCVCVCVCHGLQWV